MPESFLKATLGSSVNPQITKKTPAHIFAATFTRRNRDGETTVSYVDYFKARYGLEIKDLGQPLLLSKLTARDRRGGIWVNTESNLTVWC